MQVTAIKLLPPADVSFVSSAVSISRPSLRHVTLHRQCQTLQAQECCHA